MARIQIPIDVLTSRLNLGERFASMRSGSLAGRFANLRPISEFFDVKRVSKPANFAEMQSRINYNLGHFSSNYAVVFSMLCIYGLITNLWLLFDIIFIVVGMFVIGKLEGRDLEFGEQRFSTMQLYTGLYVIAVPIAFFSGVFSTMMWLIGGLGGRPRAPKSAPQWGRPSRRERRTHEARNGDEERWWEFGQRVVEELDSDGDFDTQGVGSASNALGHRFVSDPLRFTGVDLGEKDGDTRARRAYAYQNGEDDETTDDSEQDSDGEGGVRLPLLDPEEEALADAAMARIRRAQAKGKKDVKLSKEELAAYQRRLQRMEDEERRQRREQREQRVAIPISHLEPASRQKRLSVGDDSVERHATYPPMGYFPPPASRSRPRSGTNSSRTPSRAATDREQSSSPFAYTYVRAEQPATLRQPSDPVTSRPLSVAESVSARNGGSPASDPFQFMTGGTRTSYHAAAGPVRNSIIEVDDIYASYGSGPSGGTSRRHSGDPREAELSDEDDRPHGARVGSGSGSRSRHRESVDSRREPAPEPRPSRERTPPPAKKSSATQSPVAKRKSVSGSTRSGRKKGK
ncbi:PRA1 family protein-domain-containing protein [Parachaetomium inaequale]|uniref:PRA1 family protein-domain-containing protein n=1 Tax=Parachaetomium inaequale TaxID=2588326 RepID=A0AAN6PR51_9PEZI|nr:PRA1 family protein-domain-containing protein [Parachaetomium inaequale]